MSVTMGVLAGVTVFNIGYVIGRRAYRGTTIGLSRLAPEYGAAHGPTWVIEFTCGTERHDLRLPRDWVLGQEQARKNE